MCCHVYQQTWGCIWCYSWCNAMGPRAGSMDLHLQPLIIELCTCPVGLGTAVVFQMSPALGHVDALVFCQQQRQQKACVGVLCRSGRARARCHNPGRITCWSSTPASPYGSSWTGACCRQGSATCAAGEGVPSQCTLAPSPGTQEENFQQKQAVAPARMQITTMQVC
jgi:hypothetical protein